MFLILMPALERFLEKPNLEDRLTVRYGHFLLSAAFLFQVVVSCINVTSDKKIDGEKEVEPEKKED